MCDKNCTCECQPVTAYKSLNGSLYLSKTECERHNKIYRDALIRKKVYDALKRALDRPMDHWKVYYDKGMTVDEVCRFISEEPTGWAWKELRVMLNAIKE